MELDLHLVETGFNEYLMNRNNICAPYFAEVSLLYFLLTKFESVIFWDLTTFLPSVYVTFWYKHFGLALHPPFSTLFHRKHMIPNLLGHTVRLPSGLPMLSVHR